MATAWEAELIIQIYEEMLPPPNCETTRTVERNVNAVNKSLHKKDDMLLFISELYAISIDKRHVEEYVRLQILCLGIGID